MSLLPPISDARHALRATDTQTHSKLKLITDTNTLDLKYLRHFTRFGSEQPTFLRDFQCVCRGMTRDANTCTVAVSESTRLWEEESTGSTSKSLITAIIN